MAASDVRNFSALDSHSRGFGFHSLRRCATIRFASSRGFGLGTSARRIPASERRAGTVWINCYNVFDTALPFGGCKQSGWGREMGRDALELYTETKAVCVQL